LGRPLRRLDAVVEGMKLCPPVGAADDALGHLVIIGPPVKFVGVVRQGRGLAGFRFCEACRLCGRVVFVESWTMAACQRGFRGCPLTSFFVIQKHCSLSPILSIWPYN